MRIFFFLSIILLIISLSSAGQVPKNMQAEIQRGVNELKKQLTDLEKQIDDAKKNKEDAETIKGLEDQLAMLKQQLDLIANVTTKVSKIPAKDIQEVSYNDYPNAVPKFPKSNPAVIAAMPKISSQAALTSYVSDLHNQFLKKVNPEIITSFKEIETKLENDWNKVAATGLTAWYSEAPSQAILLLTKAALQPKPSDITINNLGALLNMGGLENRSLPILRWLETLYPQNAMVLNNLGQAYAGLGELNDAMRFLGRCIAIEPNHPQASCTAGQIELSRGNNTAALQHFKNSLKGAYTEEADRRVRFVEPEMKLEDYVKHNLHMPEYFNEMKYNVPPQCQNVSEAERLWAVYNGYRDMIGALKEKYHVLALEYQDKTTMKLKKRSQDAIAGKEINTPPFIKKGMLGWNEMMKKYNSDGEWLAVMDRDYEKRRKEIFDNYVATAPTNGECAALTAHVNQYMRDMADATAIWQRKHTAFNKKYINQAIYWSFLISFSNDEFKLRYYTWISNYLGEMGHIAKTELSGPPCIEIKQGNTPTDEIPLLEPDCPINLELKLIVGKIKLNCDKFEISGGEGVKFKYEKNFKSKQSTFSVGIGVTFELSKNFGGGYEGSVSVDAGESVFITLDGNNNFSDLGLSLSAKASIGVEKSSSMAVGEIVQQISSKSDVMGAEVKAGYTVGVNSGINFTGKASFTPGPLSYLK